MWSARPEIEVEEVKPRRPAVGRIALGALATCVLVLVLRQLM